ncbi:DUF4254 domain-containing protein [Nocardia sp. NPDC049707]|uniref:DUF4254 domain-containing protein n=1 Tax=Nocardia sp. NPDC049707 TaxID=3154735 RepID=UPI00342C45A0
MDACRRRSPQGHPVLRAVGELVRLHERWVAEPDRTRELDRARAELVHDIDCWVARSLPVAHGGARLHTETVGAVLDRIAQLSLCADAALARAGTDECHAAWTRLAQLAEGYRDLAEEIGAGIRRLPDWVPAYAGLPLVGGTTADAQLPQRIPRVGPPVAYAGAPPETVERFADAVRRWAAAPELSRCRPAGNSGMPDASGPCRDGENRDRGPEPDAPADTYAT